MRSALIGPYAALVLFYPCSPVGVGASGGGADPLIARTPSTGQPVAVCGTAGPGVVHLMNGLPDARKEGAPVIAIASDVESPVHDSGAVQQLNPYTFVAAAALYIGRSVPAVVAAVALLVATTGGVTFLGTGASGGSLVVAPCAVIAICSTA